MTSHTEPSTMAACIAAILHVPTAEVPLDGDQQRAWLAQRGLGMLSVADPRRFAWAGPWVALRPSVENGRPCAVVMYGVPSGVIWDPAETTDEILDGWVVAALDVADWTPPRTAEPRGGVVEAIVIAATAGGAVTHVDCAAAIAGAGLKGDRYATGAGTFASGRPGSALTLIAAETLEQLEQALGREIDHRRNVVTRGTDLNALVGREFRLGELVCAGRRLCQPCAHLDRLNHGGVLRPLVNQGGLRADILAGGTLRVGDELVVD